MVEDDILTWDGLRQLKAELDYLKGEKRRQMAAKMKEALAFGDPWDNAEYATVKAEQMLIEGRIMVLENLLRNVQVLPPGCNPSDRVEVGSWVRVLDMETQEEHCYRIVGSREADTEPHAHFPSFTSCQIPSRQENRGCGNGLGSRRAFFHENSFHWRCRRKGLISKVNGLGRSSSGDSGRLTSGLLSAILLNVPGG